MSFDFKKAINQARREQSKNTDSEEVFKRASNFIHEKIVNPVLEWAESQVIDWCKRENCTPKALAQRGYRLVAKDEKNGTVTHYFGKMVNNRFVPLASYHSIW